MFICKLLQRKVLNTVFVDYKKIISLRSSMDPDPTEQMTFWSVVIGSIYVWGAHIAVHPGAIQRFIAVSTLREAKL